MGLTVLDAGVLIGVLDGNDPHHERAVGIMRDLDRRGESWVAPATVYAEVLVAPLRAGERLARRVEEFFDDMGIRVEPTGRAIARAAAALRAAHGPKLRLPDAVVVATGQVLQADRVLTTDRRWPARLPIDVEVL
jgi:predicted nucleic acid-binding protein